MKSRGGHLLFACQALPQAFNSACALILSQSANVAGRLPHHPFFRRANQFDGGKTGSKACVADAQARALALHYCRKIADMQDIVSGPSRQPQKTLHLGTNIAVFLMDSQPSCFTLKKIRTEVFKRSAQP
jgi:hypothetical protein